MDERLYQRFKCPDNKGVSSPRSHGIVTKHYLRDRYKLLLLVLLTRVPNNYHQLHAEKMIHA